MSESEQPAGDAEAERGESPTEEVVLPEVIEENARLKAELEESKAQTAKYRKDRWRRVRVVSVGILVFLAVLSLVVSAVGVWVHQTVFNTDRYVALVGPLAAEPAVQDALATYTTDQIFAALQLETRLKEALPGQLDVVVGPVANAARNYVRDGAEKFFASPGFQQLWVQINTVAHEKVVALIKGDYAQLPNVTINGGEVRLNTIPIITEVLRGLVQSAAGFFGLSVTIPQISPSDIPDVAREKLQQALGVSLPADFGQITIMQESKLNDVQTAVRWFDRLVYALIALTLILMVLAIVFSVNRRRTLIELGIGVVVGLLVFRGLVRVIQNRVVEAVTNPQARGAAKAAVGSVAANLRTAGEWVLLLAIVVAIVAYVAGRPRWLMRLVDGVRQAASERPGGSKLERWVAGHADLLRWGGALVAAVLLFVTGLGWIPLIVIGVLLGLYLWGIAALDRRARAAAANGDAGPPGQDAGGGAAVGTAVGG